MKTTKKKVPDPGYVTTKPLYPSLVGMKDEVGFQDAAIQLGELASQFLSEHAQASAIGVAGFLQREFAMRAIPHGTTDFSHLMRFSHQSFLVQTYALIDGILRQLGREYRAHKWLDEGWLSSDGEDTLSPTDVLLRNLPTSEASKLSEKPEIDLLDYYRLLRVSIVHRTPQTTEKAKASHQQLTNAHPSYFMKVYRLAPNPPDLASFTDFLLLTRSFKYVSNAFNEACDLNHEDIQAYVKYRDRTVLQILQLPKAKQYGALKTYLLAQYGAKAPLNKFDHAIVRYLRLRGELSALIAKENSKKRLKNTSITVTRDGAYTIKITSKKEADKKVELIEGLAISEAIAHFGGL